MHHDGGRNAAMAERIGAASVDYPFSFVIAGDSGAWPDPTADAIFSDLVRQTAALDPAPAFFANLGDFAGPGTQDRHERYLTLVAPLALPNVCLIGNHDLEDPAGAVLLHAPPNLDGHYAPQPECGFKQGEPEFVDIVSRHGVTLVCCAHGLGYDHHVQHGTRFVMSGGGGAALYLSYKNAGSDRGAIFHAVEITLRDDGSASGRVLQAFAPAGSEPPFTFSD